MSVVIVLREASRTGPVRIAGLIAAALKEHRQVRILCIEEGGMLDWLQECVGAHNVRVIQTEGLSRQASFGERIRSAQTILQNEPGEIVYINSLAPSEFIVAAKAAGKFAVLHIHENAALMRTLLAQHFTSPEVVSLCDAVVLQAANLRQDILEVFAAVPERTLTFGAAVDIAALDQGAQTGKVIAANAAGTRYKRSKRMLIGMMGEASERKGSDIFLETAKAVREHDFMWVGTWTPGQGRENPAYDEFFRAQLPNFFVSGSVGNPYKYMSRFDLFFLSSRDDPNPVALAEALCLDVPILAFSRSTLVTDFLGRTSLLCHGHVNVPDAARVLKALNRPEVGLLSLKGRVKEHRRQFDIRDKITGLVDLLAALGA